MRFAFSQLLRRIVFAIRCLWPHKKHKKTSHRSARERLRNRSEEQSRKTKGVKIRNKKHTHTHRRHQWRTRHTYIYVHIGNQRWCAQARKKETVNYSIMSSASTPTFLLLLLFCSLYCISPLLYVTYPLFKRHFTFSRCTFENPSSITVSMRSSPRIIYFSEVPAPRTVMIENPGYHYYYDYYYYQVVWCKSRKSGTGSAREK